VRAQCLTFLINDFDDDYGVLIFSIALYAYLMSSVALLNSTMLQATKRITCKSKIILKI